MGRNTINTTNSSQFHIGSSGYSLPIILYEAIYPQISSPTLFSYPYHGTLKYLPDSFTLSVQLWRGQGYCRYYKSNNRVVWTIYNTLRKLNPYLQIICCSLPQMIIIILPYLLLSDKWSWQFGSLPRNCECKIVCL